MNKGLKVLSGVLALTIGLATAGMVGAVDKEKTGLSKGAQEILKVKEPSAPEYKFYESITTKPEYAALLKKADKEYKGLQADSAEWARLSTLACNAAQSIESINNQLDAIGRFIALADDMYTVNGDKYAELTVPEQGDPTLEENKAVSPKALELMTPEAKEMKDLLATNAALVKEFKALKKASDATKVGENGAISGKPSTQSLADRFAANVEAIKELAEYVSTDEYQEAAEYVANYTEEYANAMKAQLLKEKTDLNGLIAFVTKIANENGLKLMDKCALPQDADVSEADKAASGEAKKDVVPNTGAHR